LTYAAEYRCETAKCRQILETIEMKSLRTIVGKIFKYKGGSKEIREVCDVQPVSTWMIEDTGTTISAEWNHKESTKL
jgi:hypothetical protein